MAFTEAADLRAITLCFGHQAQLDEERVACQLQNVDDSFAAAALAHEAAKFSRNVRQKHKWADRAFLLASSSLIFLLLASASYWLRVLESRCSSAGSGFTAYIF